MEHLPVYIGLAFILTTFAAVLVFYKASGKSGIVVTTLLLWLILQTIIAKSGFYTVTNTAPPRFVLLVLPPLMVIAGLFATKKGRGFLDSLDIKALTLLHVVRIPVELVLLGLFLHKAVPSVMTFEGRNFDILSGLTAPVIYYLAFVRKSISHKVLLAWNIVCPGLLINIVAIAILSAPFPFQKMAFDRPNIAILYFPFVWLPGCLVPLVLLAHLATIKQLLKRQKEPVTAIAQQLG